MPTATVTAARALPPAKRRRLTTIVLVIGTVLSLGAALGPVWMVRGGVLVAIAAAVATSVLAWREVTADRRDHAAAMLAASRAHGDVLRNERAHNSAVLHVVTDRNVAALAEITRQQTVIAQLRGEITSLKGDRAALTAEVGRREAAVAELRRSVRLREAELAAVRADLEAAEQAAERAAEEAARQAAEVAVVDAEVHAMPRRVLLDGEESPRRASGGAAPIPLSPVPDRDGVEIDQNGLDRGLDRAPEWHEPVLPNYEEDRRLA